MKTRRSVVGKACGSNRSVIDARPDGISGIRSRSFTAMSRARSNRVGEPTPFDASIERDVSMTKNAWASMRSGTDRVVPTTGCAEAMPSRIGTAARHGERSEPAKRGSSRPMVPDPRARRLAGRRSRAAQAVSAKSPPPASAASIPRRPSVAAPCACGCALPSLRRPPVGLVAGSGLGEEVTKDEVEVEFRLRVLRVRFVALWNIPIASRTIAGGSRGRSVAVHRDQAKEVQ